MSRPTHRVSATGELVFPEGYAPDMLEAVDDTAWAEIERDNAWAAVRARRDALLAETDVTQLADRPEEVQMAWRPYRQALRDLPSSGEDPAALEWPERP